MSESVKHFRVLSANIVELLDGLISGLVGQHPVRHGDLHVLVQVDPGHLRPDQVAVVLQFVLNPQHVTIAAERREEVTEKGRSEFHYGSFVRRVSLPVGAEEDKLAARYQDGILEVSVPVEATQAEPRTIAIARGSVD